MIGEGPVCLMIYNVEKGFSHQQFHMAMEDNFAHWGCLGQVSFLETTKDRGKSL